jgi:tetratricopeptide (TPR) repeat protein
MKGRDPHRPGRGEPDLSQATTLADVPPEASICAEVEDVTLAVSPHVGRGDSVVAAPAMTLAASGSSLVAEDITGATLAGDGPTGGGGMRTWPIVPGYEILGELGRGGMGVVYLARQLRLNRPCALKMILAGEHASKETGLRFLAEAETVARLRHPNIVQIYAIGDHDGRPFFELEYLDCGSLAERFNGTPLPPRDAARLLEPLARAMDEAHRLGIVHRDLKPGNILLAADGVPKITDFGLAKSKESGSGLTRSESILGTPSYMAPEQAEGRTKEAGPAADIYSLGAVFYEALTGRPPFRAPTVLQTLDLVKNTEPVPPARLVPGLARDAETICLKCLEKEPHRRYATAAALADDLARYVREEPIRARPVPFWEHAWKWARRHPSSAALVGVCTLVLVIGLVAGLALRSIAARRAFLERQRIAGLTRQAQGFFLNGRLAYERRDWTGADTQLGSALALIESEPKLASLRPDVEALRSSAAARRAADAARDTAHTRLAQFDRLRDEAVFHQSRYTGLDPVDDVKATRRAARDALQLFRAAGTAGDATLELPPDQFGEEEHAQIVAKYYELLLILAAAEAETLAGEDAAEHARAGLALLDQAQRIHPLTRAYHARRADCLARLGRAREAAAEERLVTESAGSENATAADEFLLGEQAYQAGDLHRAIESFRRALNLQPDHFWAQYLLAVCHIRSQHPAEAQSALLACQALRPSFIWIHLLKGVAEGELKEFDLAEADFRSAEQMGPDENALYVLLVNRGVMRIRRGDPEAAVRDLESAASRRPHAFAAYINLAQAHLARKHPEDAVAALDRAVAEDPGQVLLYRERSRAHRARGDATAALADLDTAIRLAGPAAAAGDQVERGRILHQAGRYEEAVAAYDATLEEKPGHLLAHRLRAAALIKLKRYDAAIRSLDICLTKGTPSGMLYETRGLAKAWSGHYAEALDDYGLAIRAGHESSSLRAYRGWAYLLSEAPRLALDEFNAAIRLDGTNADAYNGRGSAHAMLHQPAAALDDARGALRLGASDARLVYNAARIYCQVVRIQQATPAMLTDGGLRDIMTTQRQAAALVGKALELVPPAGRAAFWKTQVEVDPALDAIRSSSGYQTLRSRYASPPTPEQARREGGTRP